MSAIQLLVSVTPEFTLAPNATYSFTHGLKSNGVAVAPTLVHPDRASAVAVDSTSATVVVFRNNGAASATVRFRCEYGLSNELDSEATTPVLWRGVANSGVSSCETGAQTVYTVTSENDETPVPVPAGVCNIAIATDGSVGSPAISLSTDVNIGRRLLLTSANTAAIGPAVYGYGGESVLDGLFYFGLNGTIQGISLELCFLPISTDGGAAVNKWVEVSRTEYQLPV